MKPKNKKKAKKLKKAKLKLTNSEIYKTNLLRFLNKDNSLKNKTLSELVDLKIKELELLGRIENSNYYLILVFSQYFIDGNDFIKDKEIYFSQIDESIYKIFNDFLMNPTEQQHKSFLQSFENLSYGFGNIYLIFKKLVGPNYFLRDHPVDYFFKMILKSHFQELKDIISCPIINDQKSLISTLNSYIRIKYNYKEVTRTEITNLLKQEPLDMHESGNIENLPKENKLSTKSENISEIVGKNIDIGIKNINNEESKIEKNCNRINILDNDKEIVHSPKNSENLSNNKTSSKNIQLNEDSEKINQINNSPKNNNIIITNYNKPIIGINARCIFFDYLEKKKKDLYVPLKLETPVLDYILKNKKKLKGNLFKYRKNENNFIDHLYDYLEYLIFSINSNLINFDENKVGYLCFYDKNIKKNVEGIYSNIDVNFLFEKVVSDENFPADDIYDPNENIAKNAFKSRALSFEYYINSEIIINLLKAKERQRVIYLFKDIAKLEALDSNQNDDANIQQNDNSFYDSVMIEVDGVILEKEYKDINLNKSFFMSDPVYKFGFFSNKDNKKEIIKYYTKDKEEKIKNEINEEINKENRFYLDEKCLCVIEIKNQFPQYRKEEERSKIPYYDLRNKYRVDFYNMFKSLVKKVLVFKEVFLQLKEEIKSIRLVLFYDAIYKFDYERELSKVMNELFSENDKNLIDTIEFQCIYIKSLYLTTGFFDYKRQLDKFQYKITTLEKEIKDLKLALLSSHKKKIKKQNDVI